MSRKKIRPDDEPWDRITQACPGAKTRFDPVVVPELIAWLAMMQTRYRVLRSELTGGENIGDGEQWIIKNDERTVGLVRYYDHCISLLSTLMLSTTDHWSRHEWHKEVTVVQWGIEREQQKAANGEAQ